MKWLKPPARKVRHRGLEPRSGLQVSKKKMFVPRSLGGCGEPPGPRGNVLGLRPQGWSNFELCVWTKVSSQLFRQPREVYLAHFSL